MQAYNFFFLNKQHYGLRSHEMFSYKTVYLLLMCQFKIHLNYFTYFSTAKIFHKFNTKIMVLFAVSYSTCITDLENTSAVLLN